MLFNRKCYLTYFKCSNFIIFRIISSLNICFIQWYTFTSSFPFHWLRSCRINGGFLHRTPTRIDCDYLFPFISTSYSRLPGTKKQTADHRKRGHREKTEGKGIGWSLTAIHRCWFYAQEEMSLITVSILDDGTKRDVTRRGGRTMQWLQTTMTDAVGPIEWPINRQNVECWTRDN